MQRLPLLQLLVPLCLLSASVPGQWWGSASAVSRAQVEQGSAEMPIAAGQIPDLLDYAKHKDLIFAKLDGRAIRLVEMVRYVNTHYDPGLEERLAVPREINSSEFPKLLHQYLLIQALRLEVKRQELAISKLPLRTDQFLASDFAKRYKPNFEKANKRSLTGETKKNLEIRHRRELGLAMELKALLDRLVPGMYKISEIRGFYRDFGRYFGGKVKFAHIFFETRDRRTGRLYQGNRMLELRAKLRTVQLALRKDPTQFEALAAKYSDDKVTREKGGVIGFVTRLNEHLPAEMLKVAWELNNGEVSKPVESYYGIHLIRRISFVQHVFPIFTPGRIKEFANFMKRLEAENLIIELKKRHKIERFM